MALQQLLSTGKSSLLAHQAAITISANNTANADVEGYSKRDVRFASLRGNAGVDIDSIRRRSDQWIDRRLYLERSRLGAQSSQSQGLSALDLQLGDIDRGVGTTMDRFFSRLRILQTSPADPQLRSDLLSEAQSVVESFNVASSMVSREREQADRVLMATVGQASDMLKEIAQLNDSIRHSLADGHEPNQDMDRRDVMLGRLADTLDISVLDPGDGSLTVLLAGGRSLVQGGTAVSLSAVPDPARGGMSEIRLTDQSGLASDITDQIGSGRIGGLLELRDGISTEIGDRLDQLAFDFASAFNAVHQGGYGTDGVDGRNFFAQPTAVAGAARTLALEAGLLENPQRFAASTNATTAVGGNDNAIALAALADRDLASGSQMTFGQEYASIVATVGSAASRQQARETQAQAQVDQLQALKDSQTGVSIDEELIDITKFERAFQSASRIIQTVEKMFDTLLQL